MSLFDGVLGGLVSAGVTSLISNVIQQHGGLQGLVSQFQQKGLGGIAESWVGTGANHSVTADQISQVLGSDTIRNLAQKLGIDESQVAAQLAAHLPGAVDKLTPSGVIPAAA
jgi:uncharacterized protein YidB (DUF937 family)